MTLTELSTTDIIIAVYVIGFIIDFIIYTLYLRYRKMRILDYDFDLLAVLGNSLLWPVSFIWITATTPYIWLNKQYKKFIRYPDK